MGTDGRTRVTQTSFRYLQTLYNLGPAPEPNLTVLWSPTLPDGFKRFCAQTSLDTSDPVRERRPDPPRVQRRHRDRLLRVGDAGGQGHAVLRRPRQPGQGPVVRDQRRPRRDHRRTGRSGHACGVRGGARLRRGARRPAPHPGLAGRNVRRRAERDPRHARQVRLRAHRDGAARPPRPPFPRHWHRRTAGRRRQPVRDQAREGEGATGPDRPGRRLRGGRGLPVLRQQRRPCRRHRRGWSRSSWQGCAPSRPTATPNRPCRC